MRFARGAEISCLVIQIDPHRRRSRREIHLGKQRKEGDAIYLLDPNGTVVTWNTGAQKIKGYRPEEIIGKNFACFYTAEDIAADKPERNLREAARRGPIRDQGLRVRKDGSTFEAEVILTALRNDEGKLAVIPK
jgi:PAS domain S-box-containing protein